MESNTVKKLLIFGSSMLVFHKINNEAQKDKIRTQWEESKYLPRKKKKQRRKELQLDYNIACYDPFNLY